MRTFYCLFALALTSTLVAQDATKPAGKFYGPLATGDWKAKAPATAPLSDADKLAQSLLERQPVTATTICSVRLGEAPIPKDVHFTAQVVQPDLAKVVPMPQAKVYAPPCAPAAKPAPARP